jgi:hypothetical protein
MRRRSGVIRCRGRDSDGAIMVMVAAILPVAILFCGFVIDVANWFQHDRHLQTQADAAALAGGISFGSCPNNTPIHDKVNEYSGQTWNSQVGGSQDNVHVLLNSRTYYNQPTRTDSTVVEGEPCAAKMVDVKVTETDLPWWFQLGSVDFLNAHARVEPKKVGTIAGSLPLGVPDVKPEQVAVTFVDEDKLPTDANRILGTDTLIRRTYANGVAIWDNVGSAVTVKTEVPHIGMRVALSGSKTTTTCGQPLVECYDAGGNDGMLYVRGWTNATATATAPKARDVRLYPDGSPACSDGYFSSTSVQCGVGVQATLDFGTGSVPSTYTVQAETGSQKKTMTFNATTGVWRTGTGGGNNGPIQVDPAANPMPVTITWKKGNTSGDFGVVHRIFPASTARSGPIKLARITDTATGLGPTNSFQTCTGCTRSLEVQLGVQGSFQDLYNDSTQVTTPVTLRFAGGVSGSQNQALDCDPWAETTGGNRGFEEEIAYGCRPAYTYNLGTTCPSSPQTLWGTSTSQADQGAAWECVAVETGDKTGQIGPGMNLRILGSKNPTICSNGNHWGDFDQINDPRVIDLFTTQFGAFGGSGQNTVAVTNFATFYVTGWRGNGNADKNPCQDQAIQFHDDPVAEAGTIVGHFFHYTGPIQGTPSETDCDFSSPTPCMPALTQ